jgi:hypothetical protein
MPRVWNAAGERRAGGILSGLHARRGTAACLRTFGEHQGQHYFSMDLIDALNLRKTLS